LLAAELEQSGYYAMHHLSVPCYMLQHNIYSREGWLWARDGLNRFVYHGLTPAMARRQNRIKVDSGHRDFSFTRGPKLPGVEQIAWQQTIADVRLDSVEHYTADVLAWAKSILADSEELVRTSSNSDNLAGGRKRKR
jgi:hypothetical protein